MSVNTSFSRTKRPNVVVRLYIMLGVLVCLFSSIIFRIIDLTLSEKDDISAFVSSTQNVTQFHTRLNIYDRNGEILATNVSTASLYAEPRSIRNPQEAAKKVAAIIPSLDYEQVFKKLSSSKNFVWLKRHLTPQEQGTVIELGLPGLSLARDERRFYPHENLCSHVIGYTDIDGNGIAGLEKKYDQTLREKELTLSLDLRVQNIVRKELMKAMLVHAASGGFAIVADVNNGEILAMSSLPDFNPHKIDVSDYKNVKRNTLTPLFNRATLGLAEMGSTFKVFTVAAGLDTHKITLNDAFNVSNPIKVGRFTINDYKGKGGYLSVPEVLMYSSNLGVAQIAQRMGIASQKKYMRQFGMLDPIDFDIPEVSKPRFPSDNNWKAASLITISYGHGIAVTPLHMVQAMSAVVNGGFLRKPTLLRKHELTTSTPEKSEDVQSKVLAYDTSITMRKLLRLIVDKGSGKKADIKGYMVGGKTGTAEKVQGGQYNKKLNTALFIAVFPINDPKYMIFIAVDEARPNKINCGYTTGGMIAAPIAAEITREIAPILNVDIQNPITAEIARSMNINYVSYFKRKAKN